MLSDNPRRPAPVARTVAPVTPSVRSQMPAVPAPRPYIGPEESNTFRKLAFYFGLALIFMRVSVLPELLGHLLGTSLFVLYIAAPPALGGIFFGGGLAQGLKSRAARYWVAFFVWMGLATIFSSWIGGSFNRFRDYGFYNLMLLFVVAGLATNWGDVRLIFYSVAAACLMNLLEARLFMDVVNGRMQLWENGTISNSNDLASQLLLVLPFVLWVTLDSKRSLLIRVPLVGAIIYGLWVIVGTASRGALVGIMAAFLFILWRANMRQRLMAIAAAAVLAVITVAILPQMTSNRLGTLFGEENEEARQSSEARSHLFRQSITYTIQHPLFGVGPDQFSNYQSMEHEVKQSMWHPTHCAWTQISSECGMPALIFVIVALGSAVLGVNRCYRTARERGNRDIANACFCYLLALVGFLVSISFLSNAYTAVLPLMVGLGISMSFAGTRQMAKVASSPMMPAPVRY